MSAPPISAALASVALLSASDAPLTSTSMVDYSRFDAIEDSDEETAQPRHPGIPKNVKKLLERQAAAAENAKKKPAASPVDAAAKVSSCALCGQADAKKRCARCNTAYCSATCQREAWKTHKKACGESPDMPTGQVCAAYVEMMRHPDVVKNVENTTMIDPRQVKVALLCGVKPEKLGPLFNHREDSWISGGGSKIFIAALNASGAAKKSCSESFYHRVLCSEGSEELMKIVQKGPSAMAAAGGVRSSLKDGDTKTIISQALERAGRRQEEEKVSEAEDFRRFARDIAAPMGFELSDEALEAMCAEKGLSSTKRAEPQSQEHMAAAVDAGIVHESVLRKGRRKKGKGGRAAASGLAAWQKATADVEELRAGLAAAEADAPDKTPS